MTEVISKADHLLRTIREANDHIAHEDRMIRDCIRRKDEARGRMAETFGRIAFIEGKKKGRNPFKAPLAQYWNSGWAAERAETLEALR